MALCRPRHRCELLRRERQERGRRHSQDPRFPAGPVARRGCRARCAGRRRVQRLPRALAKVPQEPQGAADGRRRAPLVHGARSRRAQRPRRRLPARRVFPRASRLAVRPEGGDRPRRRAGQARAPVVRARPARCWPLRASWPTRSSPWSRPATARCSRPFRPCPASDTRHGQLGQGDTSASGSVVRNLAFGRGPRRPVRCQTLDRPWPLLRGFGRQLGSGHGSIRHRFHRPHARSGSSAAGWPRTRRPSSARSRSRRRSSGPGSRPARSST